MAFKYPLLACLYLYTFLISNAQDTTKFSLHNNLTIDMMGGGYYQAPLKNEAYRMPEFIQSQRNLNIPHIGTDHPLLHGAYYAGLHTNLLITKGVTFHADFIGEHRGFSYGVYDTDNMIVYPRAEFTADRTISLFQKPLNFYVSVGNKQDVRLYEGLALYNLDAQGWDIHAQWAKFRITYHQLSDLHRWIGLNIGDSYDLLMSLEGLNITDTWKTDIKAGSYIYDSSPSLTEPTGIKVSASIYGGHTRFYLQSALRFNPDTSFQNKTAFVVGATRSLEQSRWSVDGRAEFRYYGSYFNRGYKNSVSYRDYNKGTYRNTIGRSLYPLSLYDRPFSQWAVFTEYTAMDVKGLTINGHGRYFMVKDLFLDLSADANLIMASGEKAFLYFYYTLAVGWQPLPDNYFMLGISNKGMNLDVHYPTHYFYKHPFFHLTLKRMIDHGN